MVLGTGGGCMGIWIIVRTSVKILATPCYVNHMEITHTSSLGHRTLKTTIPSFPLCLAPAPSPLPPACTHPRIIPPALPPKVTCQRYGKSQL